MSLIHADSLDGFSLFVGPSDFGGTITKMKTPMPKRDLKDRRPGGTNMNLKTQHGWSLENYEFTAKGLSSVLMKVMGGRTIDAKQLFVRGAWTDEFTGQTQTLEIEIWGRTEENDFIGELEGEEDNEGSFTFAPLQARCVYAGVEVYYYNARTGEVRIDETDVTEAIRIALGRS
ncbi:MAG: phage major tail tube protein [Pseudomonadota bacterium]